MNAPPEATTATGAAYGLRFAGLETRGCLLPALGERAPLITVGRDPVPAGEPAQLPDEERAVIDLDAAGRRLALDRHARTATFSGPALSAEDLVHPYLGPVATVFSRWLGREAYHAGAFVAGGGAWAVVGPMEAGKSSLLAAMFAEGHDVLAEDILVVERGMAFAGPRAIDLRSPPLSPLADRIGVERVREGNRWRVRLPPIPIAMPLRGWFHLSWTDALRIERIPPRHRLRLAAGLRGWSGMASDPEAVLELAALPAFAVGRPRSWKLMPEVVKRLTELATSDTAITSAA